MLYLGQIKFLCPTRVPLGIVEMDFEMILGVPFFYSNSQSIMLWTRYVWRKSYFLRPPPWKFK